MRAKPRHKPVKMQIGRKSWRTHVMMFVCASLLVSGFFLAARQHFSSMDFGIKNSRLRRHIDDLEAEKRRLVLARETSLSPGEIKRAAKRAGLTEYSSHVGEVAQKISSPIQPATFQRTKPVGGTVVKTSSVEPTAGKPKTLLAAVEKIDKPLAKKALMAE
ncbi:MAG: hypothetical protein WKF34_10670 [Pyrinomonadaceae bacterium]